MEENKESGGFRYTYSAKEQEELRRIREKYSAPTESEDKMARLRRLDEGATAKAQIVALVLGIIGTLIMGFGMSLVMSEIGFILFESRALIMPLGIGLGLFGGVLLGLAYPLYSLVLKRERRRIAPEILRLTEELMK